MMRFDPRPLVGLMPQLPMIVILDIFDKVVKNGNSEIASLLAQEIDHLPDWLGLVLAGLIIIP
jgi:hypothetical protein